MLMTPDSVALVAEFVAGFVDGAALHYYNRQVCTSVSEKA
jgi:hypothetical protein